MFKQSDLFVEISDEPISTEKLPTHHSLEFCIMPPIQFLYKIKPFQIIGNNALNELYGVERGEERKVFIRNEQFETSTTDYLEK
jgi:hypothetical protein